MIIAFLEEFKTKNNADIAEILDKFFYFYGKEFNSNKTGISLNLESG